MGINNWLLVSRLKRAVKKITFLLNFNTNRWRLASVLGASSSKRRLSFNDRPGLRALADDTDEFGGGGGGGQDSAADSFRGLQRTVSYPSEDDVDKRAEMFITNFYRQLQLERQISLEVRYYRGNSFDSSSITSP